MDEACDLLVGQTTIRKRWIVPEIIRGPKLRSVTMLMIADYNVPMFFATYLIAAERWIPRAIVPAAVIFALWAFRKYVPAQDPKAGAGSKFDTVDAAAFQNVQWMVNVAIFFVIVVIGVLSYNLLVLGNRWIAKMDGPAEFVLYPQQAIWWFLPGFGGLCFGWEIVLWLWRRFGDRHRARKYEAWSNMKYGMNGTKILRWIGALIVLPVGVLTLLALPMHCTLSAEQIQMHAYATLSPQVYRYTEARRLTLVDGYRDREGTLDRQPGIVLDFADGRRWDSRDGTEILEELDPNLLQFVESKTGLTVEHCATVKDIPAMPDVGTKAR